MWFKPYYDIEADRVGRDRELCASAILSPEPATCAKPLGNASPLVEGDKCFRDGFEQRNFAGKAGQMVPLIELARLFAIRNWHPGGYSIIQTGYLPNIYFVRKDEGGRAVRKLHQIHMAIKIEDLAHNDRHLLKPAGATISNQPA